MTNWQLGDRVLIKGRLKKYRMNTTPREYRMWAPAPVIPVYGVVMGKRVLANNYVHQEPYTIPAAVETDKVSAYLVSYDMRRAPVYVLPEHMERVL